MKKKGEQPLIVFKRKSAFPRHTIQQSLALALAIKDKNGGNPWATKMAAEAIGMSEKGNAFFYFTAAARDYGLTIGSRGTKNVELAPLGREIVYASTPEIELEKKREAFCRIELFKQVLDYYNGSDLPEMKYLGNTLESRFGVLKNRHDEFSRIFRENCQYLQITSGGADPKRQTLSNPPLISQTNGHRPSTVTLAESKGANGHTAFVIIPFSEREATHPKGFFSEVLRHLITPAASEAGFAVKTAIRQGSDVIQSTIINDLMQADLVIADLTEHNPNVLFELGVRIMNKKPVALIKASGTGRVFDVENMIRVFEYQSTLWKSAVESDLVTMTEHIRGTWETRDEMTPYIDILLKNSSGTQSSLRAIEMTSIPA